MKVGAFLKVNNINKMTLSPKQIKELKAHWNAIGGIISAAEDKQPAKPKVKAMPKELAAVIAKNRAKLFFKTA